MSVTVHGQERGTSPFSRVIDEFHVLVVSGSLRFSAVKMRQSPARERSQRPGTTVLRPQRRSVVQPRGNFNGDRIVDAADPSVPSTEHARRDFAFLRGVDRKTRENPWPV